MLTTVLHTLTSLPEDLDFAGAIEGHTFMLITVVVIVTGVLIFRRRRAERRAESVAADAV